ncbi:MAG TPA: hypothetical protein VGU20_21155 [Stellaceae bacterium]|nr:hypothetical protein [Stellaceae bacterium]
MGFEHRREVEVYDGSGNRVWRGPIVLAATGDPNLAPADEAFERAAVARCRKVGHVIAGDAKASAKVVYYLGGYTAHPDIE